MANIKSPREREVKMKLNDEEFSEFEKECIAADVERSPLLRKLSRQWIEERVSRRKNSDQHKQKEGPACGHHPPSFCGRGHSQGNYGAPHQMRRRL